MSRDDYVTTLLCHHMSHGHGGAGKVGTMASAAFDRAIFGRGKLAPSVATENVEAPFGEICWPKVQEKEGTVRFHVFAPHVEAGHSVWVVGSLAGMGSIAAISPCVVPLVRTGQRMYVGQVMVKKGEASEFKFVIGDAVIGVAVGQVVAKSLILMHRPHLAMGWRKWCMIQPLSTQPVHRGRQAWRCPFRGCAPPSPWASASCWISTRWLIGVRQQVGLQLIHILR